MIRWLELDIRRSKMIGMSEKCRLRLFGEFMHKRRSRDRSLKTPKYWELKLVLQNRLRLFRERRIYYTLDWELSMSSSARKQIYLLILTFQKYSSLKHLKSNYYKIALIIVIWGLTFPKTSSGILHLTATLEIHTHTKTTNRRHMISVEFLQGKKQTFPLPSVKESNGDKVVISRPVSWWIWSRNLSVSCFHWVIRMEVPTS